MTRFISMLSLLAVVLLSGCAATHPEERGYTAAETQQLALEALSRRGLSFDEYNAQKEQLLHPQVRTATAYSEFGQTNAAGAVVKLGHQG